MSRTLMAGAGVFAAFAISLAGQTPVTGSHRLEASPDAVAYGYYRSSTK